MRPRGQAPLLFQDPTDELRKEIDRLGGYDSYGVAERYDVTKAQNLLPMGVAEGCVLKHDVAKDQVLTYDDVILPTGRLIDALRAEQAALLAH